MSPRLRRILFNLASILLGGGLLYLALRRTDFAEVGRVARQANYWWLLPLLAGFGITIWLRAWRWVMLLGALPAAERQFSTHPVGLKPAAYSLMIGYLVNMALPRVGEFARAGNLAAQEKLSFSGVFGTVVVERIIDMVLLILMLLASAVLLLDRPEALDRLLVGPLHSAAGGFTPALGLILLGVGLALAGAGWWTLRRLRARRADHPGVDRFLTAVDSFLGGMMTVFRSRQRLGLVLTSLGIWTAYLFMTHFPFIMFGMDQAFGLTLSDSFIVLTVGAVGFVVPSPGGTGSFHYAVVLILGLLGVAREPAVAYAVFSHAVQLIFYVVGGTLCLFLQGTGWTTLRRRADRAALPSPAPEDPVGAEHP